MARTKQDTQFTAIPDIAGFDLEFTPRGYFVARDLGLALPSDIKGRARRDAARRAAEDGDALPPGIAAPELSDDVRRALGAIHPHLMGGEYLPGMRGVEVEIARVSLRSVTSDQISVRARRTKDGIRYSIEDEYETRYAVRPRTRPGPLPMRALVGLLDYHDLVMEMAFRQADGGASLDRAREFVRVESDFYPDLGAYYEARLDLAFAEMAAERAIVAARDTA